MKGAWVEMVVCCTNKNVMNKARVTVVAAMVEKSRILRRVKEEKVIERFSLFLLL